MPSVLEPNALGKPIASGRTAEIYAMGDRWVLKLFHATIASYAVDAERRNTQTAHELGISTPLVGDLVEKDGRLGIIFERAEGQTMQELLNDPHRLEALAVILAELHLDLHQYYRPKGLTSQCDLLTKRILGCTLLSRQEQQMTTGALAQLPDGEALCHGDFHPGNVMMTRNGPVILDWADASRGNPIADVARTSLLFLGHIEQRPACDVNRTAMERFYQTYLHRYMSSVAHGWSEYYRWLPIMAAARLQEGITEQQEWLLEVVRSGLAKHNLNDGYVEWGNPDIERENRL
jgi:uncharacterized protein (TIGR02172 family)